MTDNAERYPPQAISAGAAEASALERIPTSAEMLRFVVPLMMGMLTYALNAVVDAAFVGQLGTAPLAAVGFANLFYVTALVPFLGLMRNSIAFTARAYGARREAEIGPLVSQYHALALMALPAVVLAALLFPWVQRLAGLTPAVAEHARVYLAIRVWEAPFSLTVILYSALYQAVGNSRFPMLVNWCALGLNVLLDYLLIFGHGGFPALGVAGSALATLVSQVCGAALMLGVTYAGGLRVRFGLRPLAAPHWGRLRTLLAVGVPQGLNDFTELSTFLAFVVLVGNLGERSLAANNIGFQVTHLLFLPGFAVGIGAASYMGRFLGAERPLLARRAVRRVAALGVAYMGALGVPLWFFGAEIARLFSADPEVIRLADAMFKVMALYQVFDGLGMALRGALNGAGDTRFPLLAMLGLALAIMLPAAWGLARTVQPPLLGAWLGLFAFIAANGLVLWWRFERGGWQRIRLRGGG